MKTKISFIIPAYNAEKYIERCVNKILELKYDSYNIIVVDDGSTDKTYDILKKIKSDKLNIVRQNNSGVSSARNKGINESESEYLMFIDADDYIIPSELDKALLSIDYKKDFYLFEYEHEENGCVRRIDLPLEEGIYNKNDSEKTAQRLINVKYSNNYLSDYFGAKIYQYIISSDFLRKNQICFPEGIHFAEDCVFCFNMYISAERFEVLKYNICHYIVYGDSASHKYRKNFWNEILAFYEKICILNQEPINNKKEFFYYYANDTIQRCFYNINKIEKKEIYNVINVVINDNNMLALNEGNFKYLTPKEKMLLFLYKRKNANGVYLVFRASFWFRKIKNIVKIKRS